MKLWRLTRLPYVAFDGDGPRRHGARWTSPGRAVVNFASEPSLAVLVVLRYLPRDLAGIADDFVLGWTEVDAEPIDIPFTADAKEKRRRGDAWLESGEGLLARVPSAVIPEADIIMMNPAHADARHVAPLTHRPFSFAETLKPPDY